MALKEGVIGCVFDEMNDSILIEKDSAKMYEWHHIIKNRVSYSLRISSSNDSSLYMKAEAESYQKLIDVGANNKLIEAFVPLQKFAYSSTASVSIMLHKYKGLPINSIRKCRPEFNDNLLIRIKYMSMILREAAITINKADFIHGFLCPDNIVFNDLSHQIKFLGCLSARSIEAINEMNKFKFSLSNLYYSLSQREDALSVEEAKNAEIKALALSIYELGFIDAISMDNEMFLKDKQKAYPEIDIEKVKAYKNTVFMKEKENKDCKLLSNLLIDIFNGKALSYKNIIDTLTLAESINLGLSDAKTIYPPKLIDFMTDISTLTNHKVRSYGSFTVYQIEYEDKDESVKSFILKVYKKDKKDSEKSLSNEADIFKSLEGTEDTFPTLSHRVDIKNIKIATNEIASEFGGHSFKNMLAFAANNVNLLDDLMNILYTIMRDLKGSHIYHGDIKLQNIALSENFKPKLFDYDISTGCFDDMDSNKNILLKGATIRFASPEVLKVLLYEEKQKSMINPYRADLYSLGKTLICCLTGCFTEFSMLCKLYGEKNIKEEDMKKLFKENFKDTAISETCGLCSQHDAFYYIKNNDKFVKNVLAYKEENGKFDPEFSNVMKFLARTVNTDPKERPNLEELKEMSEKHAIVSDSHKIESNCYMHLYSIKDFNIIKSISHKKTPQTSIPDLIFYQVNRNRKSNKYFIYDVLYSGNYFEQKHSFKLANAKEILPLPNQCKCVQLMKSNASIARLFVIGGIKNSKYIASTQEYRYGEFENRANMKSGRYEFGVISFNQLIVVAGGYGHDGTPYLKSVELYNAKEDKWYYISQMKEGRKECSMCAYENNIYIIGGIRYSTTHEANLSIYSRCIEIVDINKKCISSCLYIKHEMFNGICAKIGIPLSANEIMIFGDSLLSNDMTEKRFHDYQITLTDEAKIQLMGISGVYSAFAAYNFIELIGKEYLIIPDFLESLSDGVNGSLIHVNANTKIVSRIVLTR